VLPVDGASVGDDEVAVLEKEIPLLQVVDVS
jgi:hypothetical protein